MDLRPPAALLRFEQRPGDGKEEGDDHLFARHLVLLQHQLQQLQAALGLLYLPYISSTSPLHLPS